MHGSRLYLVGAFAILFCVAMLLADDRSAPTTDKALDHAVAFIDLVAEHHVEPPTGQEMVLAGAKALFRAAQRPAPFGLSQRVSRMRGPEEFRAFLEEVRAETAPSITNSNGIEFVLLNGIAAAVAGETFLVSADEFKVQEQLAGNRYVGIGVVLTFDRPSGYPAIMETFARGMAHQEGAKRGDLIKAIDGVDTHKMPLKRVVDMLRGEEGTSVKMTVFSPGENERTMTVPRKIVPRQTVRGYEERAKEQWDYRVKGATPIAYARISEFSSSTVHELRQLERELKAEDFRALILDLRGWNNGRLQETALVADALLDGGVIGQVRTSKGVRKFEADADCLFRNWPMAVLVSEETGGESEWLAAALQDNKRAVLVGRPTQGRGLTFTSVPTADGGAVTLATGLLERGDGTTLAAPAAFRPRGPVGDGVDVPVRTVKPDHPFTEPRRSQPKTAEFSPDGGRKIGADGKPQADRSSAKEPADPGRPAKETDALIRKAVEVLEAALADPLKKQQANRGSE